MKRILVAGCSVALAATAYERLLRERLVNWGATPEEVSMPIPWRSARC